jgi:hypothetical protein
VNNAYSERAEQPMHEVCDSTEMHLCARAHDARNHARSGARVRANACTRRVARRFTRRKCLIYARECFFIHVMRFSSRAVARSDSSSQVGFGAGHRTDGKDFDRCTHRTIGVVEIAASMDAKLTAGAGFGFAVS